MPTLREPAEIRININNTKLWESTWTLEEKNGTSRQYKKQKSKKKIEKYYNSRVRRTSFKSGDMVYRSNEASHAKDEDKLRPKWEGPYQVKVCRFGKGDYKLKGRKGMYARTWNNCTLRSVIIH
ncbi:hypothetical protein Tco_0991139 [Tanacetum coccineum]|uniref:Reverse transcriptase domain-containing protein n=1 Tax=Tanacetum coccineum TaxID=301880 RepID=A0ABQ5EZL5_9ASTR